MNVRVLAAAALLACASLASAHPEPVSPRAGLKDFFIGALGAETVLQFAACTESGAAGASDFVFGLAFSYTTAEQSITVGCLDGRGEPNTTDIRMARYNAGRPVETRIVWVDIGPDLYQLWRGEATDINHYVGELDAASSRAALAAAAAQIRAERAMLRAQEAAEQFSGTCP